MIGALRSEALKLRRSLVLLVMAVPSLMIFLLGVLVIISGNSSGDWQRTAISATAIWSYFLLPMTATGLTALLAQLEHANHSWSVVLTTGTPRWQVFASKAAIASIAILLVSFSVWIAVFLSGHLAGLISPENALEEAPPYILAARTLGLMWLASWLLIALQLAIALRFSSFAMAVSVGIGGTFVAVAATSSRWGMIFPWLLPVNVLASDPARASLAIAIGSIGGLLAFVLMIVWLSRRDWG